MIIGIGIDSTDIFRFKSWNQKSNQSLMRLFNKEEIAYIFKSPFCSAERFAVRFAAKEAFIKAIRQKLAPECPLLTGFKAVSIAKHQTGAPFLQVNWEKLLNPSLQINISTLKTHLSLSHSRTTATAFVVIESITMIN